MVFVLSKADQDALDQVEISIFPDEVQSSDFTNVARSNGPYILSRAKNNLQFPPLMTKDSKSSVWEEKSHSGSFEPFKVYKMSNSRTISLEFQYVTGGKFTGKVIQDIISNIRAYFYYANVGAVNGAGKYPTVTINNFYGIIPGIKTTWRMMNVDIKRSKEMVKSEDNKFYALHTTIMMNLESVTQMAKSQDSDSKVDDAALVKRPLASWF